MRPPSLADWRWLAPPRGRHKLVAVFQAYFDDSGTHDKATVCVAAGYLASTRNWGLFESRWREATKHLPNGFHAEEHLESGKMQSTVDALLQILHEAHIKQIVSAIDVRSFMGFNEDERRFLTGGLWNPRMNALKGGWTFSGSPNRPFNVPFIRVVQITTDEVTAPSHDVRFMFDQQQVLYGYMRDMYGTWRKYGTNPKRIVKMGEISEGDRRKHPALQAADLLAYCWYRVLVRTVDEFGELTPTKAPADQTHLYKFNFPHARHGRFYFAGSDEPFRCVANFTRRKGHLSLYSRDLMKEHIGRVPMLVRGNWK